MDPRVLTGNHLTIERISALVQCDDVEVLFETCVHEIVSQARTFLEAHSVLGNTRIS